MSKNPAYSLRAMAKQLSLQPSHLSGILKGTKNLSVARAYELAGRLGLTGRDVEYFYLLVDHEHAKAPELKHSLLERLRNINSRYQVTDLSVEVFKAISDWYHIPIIEMTALDEFDFNAENISRRLRITKIEAERAIERLERLELIERDENGRYKKVHANALFKSQLPNKALRQFHKQMITKAGEALDEQSPNERYVGSQTFSIDPEQLDEASKLIEKFRAALVQLFNNGKKKTRTYHLGVQLFSLLKKEE